MASKHVKRVGKACSVAERNKKMNGDKTPNGGRGIVAKGIKQCRYCKWYVKDYFQCTYSHELLLPDEVCEHFELKEQENE